ncbi:MAG: NUDIX hydrolase [Chloroflexota bacterium]
MPDRDSARPSASVILVRDAPAGFEVFMVRRPATASAFADVFVFPGGTVREDDVAAQPGDAAFSPDDALAELTQRGSAPPVSPGRAIALWRAAIRELFEEAGVLLARDALGQPLRISDAAAPRFATYRGSLQAGQTSLATILSQERLTVDYHQLRYFSHWITPSHLPRRFDTRFFATELPVGQTALHCQIETTEGIWISPRDALARADAGQLGIVFPTRKHLERLAPRSSVDDLLGFAAGKAIRTVQPVLSRTDGAERIALEAEVGQCW